jgi:hypothetical protein
MKARKWQSLVLLTSAALLLGLSGCTNLLNLPSPLAGTWTLTTDANDDLDNIKFTFDDDGNLVGLTYTVDGVVFTGSVSNSGIDLADNSLAIVITFPDDAGVSFTGNFTTSSNQVTGTASYTIKVFDQTIEADDVDAELNREGNDIFSLLTT